MAEAPRSSFIPKQAASATPKGVRRNRRFNVFRFLTSVLFLIALLGSGGVFFYKDYVQSQLDEEVRLLGEEKATFNVTEYNRVQDFDRRLRAAEFLLNNHISPSKVFDVLELTTLERIQFKNFQFDQDPGETISLSIQGGTEEFKTAALQAFEYDNNAVMRDAIFTNLAKQGGGENQNNQGSDSGSGGSVSFTIANITPASFLLYDGDAAPVETFLEESESAEMTESSEETIVPDVSIGVLTDELNVTIDQGGDNQANQ